MSVKCFLVEATGRTETNEYLCGCGCGERRQRTLKEYRRLDTGEIRFGWPGYFGPGAMYFEPSYVNAEGKPFYWDNDPGVSLHVICPNGHPWNIDGRASNCGSPLDRVHRCWIRHGEPPNITVDKKGLTCSAGAGSILVGDYHGFLREGMFT